MNEKRTIIEIFEAISSAYHNCGSKYVNKKIDAFLNDLKTGEFFELPTESQISILNWYCEAYLGRGDLVWGLIEKGGLSKEFPSKMQIGVWLYFLTLQISEKQRTSISEYLERSIKQ